jgi:hypothetical protein
MNNGLKLNDEQVRRFICDGIIVLDSDISASIHQKIFDKIQWNNTREFNMGNNVLPRVPELQKVLDSPVIHGAMQSVLGDDYILHPHRFMHASEPVDAELREIELAGDEHEPVMGKGSSGSSRWHQDSQSPLSRARYHVPRLAMILYFPQDTPVDRGPTRVIPGTHLQTGLQESNYPFAFVCDTIKAGTCFLLAFDIAHAAFPNKTDLSRYMFKFVFMRTRNPTAPTWDGGKVPWQAPAARLGQYEHTKAWAYIWDWMRGTRQDSVQSKGSDIESPIGQLNGGDPASGLHAIYELAPIGSPVVTPLVKSLLSHVGRKLERYKDDKTKKTSELRPREWNEGAFAMQDEAYALGAMGAPAIDALISLLQHEDPWITINAAFALGEVGPEASVAMSALAQQLDDQSHQVVRATLDAIACIGVNTGVALPAIRRLLSEDNPDWQEILMRGWTGESQVRFNAMCALLNSDIPVSEIEDLLVNTFDDPNGYVPALAVEALTRDGSAKALRSAISFLKAHRWDDTLAKEIRVF